MNIKKMNLHLFSASINTTDTGGLTAAEMKTYYSTYMIRLMDPLLVHDKFAKKINIPANHGKKIEVRAWDKLPKATKPLTEGVTPAGSTHNVSTVMAEIKQYGDYSRYSDLIQMTAIDNFKDEAARAHASQAGRTLDTITREVVVGGTNVQYAEGQVESRAALIGGSTKPEENCYMTANALRMGVRTLTVMDAPKFEGKYFACIIHPDIAFDLTKDPAWKDVKNNDPADWYAGKIGPIAGVRFFETSEAKVFKKAGTDSSSGSPETTQRDVYATMLIADGAYATTELENGGLEFIVKQLGSEGAGDPLNQRATTGWKSDKAAVRLVEEYMLRIETTSTFNDAPEN